jgi:hypothetical protein
MLLRPQPTKVKTFIAFKMNQISGRLTRIIVNFHSYRFLPYITILLFLLLAVFARILFNGMVYRFDFGLYQPDGVHYTLRTLMMLGKSDFSAASTVTNWYAEHGTKVTLLNPEDLLPRNNPAWPVVAPRVLYPFLSIPFVSIIGIPGMLVIPSLSLLVTIFAVYFQSRRMNLPWVGMILAIAITISPTTLRWAISNCTDSLLMGIFSIAMLLIVNMKNSKKHLVGISIVVAASCLTRFCLPIWIFLTLVTYKSKRTNSIAILLTGILFTAPTFMYKTRAGKIPASDNFSTIHDYIKFPYTFIKIFFVEFVELAVLDRLLMILILVAMIVSFASLRRLESQLFYAVFIGVFTLGAINGVLGVNFRYQLPLIPFSAGCIIAFLSQQKLKNEANV